MHTVGMGYGQITPAGPAQWRARLVLTAPFTRRTWAETAYALTDLPAAAAGSAVLAAVLCIGPALIIAAAGIPVTAGLACMRPLAAAERFRARILLHVRLPRLPPPLPREAGFFGWVRPAMADTAGWRVVGYLILHLPCAAVTFTVAAGFWGAALLRLLSPLWQASAGQAATVPQALAAAGEGAVLLLAAPWAVRGAVLLSKLLLGMALDPAADGQRVRQLELARGHVIENSAQLLRRIERNLHDGAQSRLVAMTMRLSVVRAQLASATGPGAEAARELLEAIHRDATEAMAELRELVVGIGPPALDGGLGAAVESLTARSPVPVDLRVSIAERPCAGIETITYFCATELVANICQHSGARRALVEITQRDQFLLLQVTDDGVGGARLLPGHGLAGLAGRIGSVDGTLTVHSPPGGPTLVTAMLPCRV